MNFPSWVVHLCVSLATVSVVIEPPASLSQNGLDVSDQMTIDSIFCEILLSYIDEFLRVLLLSRCSDRYPLNQA